MFDDLDFGGVLPTPATFFENPYGAREVPGRVADGASLNLLEDLLSPPDDDNEMFSGERTPPASSRDDTLSASEDEDESEFGEMEQAVQDLAVVDVASASEDVFPLDMDDEEDGHPHSLPMRIAKVRISPDKRYSPFGLSGSPSPRPRGRALVAPKLSSSLPLAALTLSPDNKKCACCGCGNTPMWRDGRDGQRLCNACGIRWQKYGVCCAVCHYVPRKLENNLGACKRCQAALPPPVPTRRRSSSTSSPTKG